MKGHPERLQVARVLVGNGLSIRSGKIYCNRIVIPPVRVGRVANVDRRTVTETLRAIDDNPDLRALF